MLKIYINVHSGVPIYVQIMEGIKQQIALGELEKGEKLPTVREVAKMLSVNPNTVARAYRELERAGVIETFVGKGTFVAKEKSEVSLSRIDRLIDAILIEAERAHLSIDEIIKKIEERGGKK